MLGAFVGTLLAMIAGSWKLVLILAIKVALFALASVLVVMNASFVALLPVAIAMGLQNTVHQVVGGADIGKSFVTGALFSMGQALAKLLTGTAKNSEWLGYATSWGSFVGGALIGAISLTRYGLTIIALFAHHHLVERAALTR